MAWLANCRISVLRGTTTDALGDPIENDVPVYTGLPMSIREVRSDETTISEGMPRQIRYLVGRARAGADIRYEDRLRDEDTGHIYLVDGIDETEQSAILNQGIRLELRRVS